MPTISTLVVDVVANTSKYNSSLSSTQTAHEKFTSGLKKVGAAIGVAFSAAAVVNFAKKSIEAFDALEKSSSRLGVGLGKLGGDASAQLDPILAWSKSFSLASGVNQADIVDMESKLTGMGSAFFKALGPGAAAAIENLTGGLQDMSAATGKSASMLMRSLGPAILNTPAKAISSLQKFGVLTQDQTDKITKLTEAGKNQAATQMEIDAITGKFGGTAAAIATPMEKLSNLFNQAEVAAGRFIEPALSGLISLFGWMGQNVELLKTVAVVVAAVAGPFLVVAAAMKVAELATLAWNLALDANPISLIAIAVALLAIIVIRNWDKIKAATEVVWHAVFATIRNVWTSIRNAITIVWHAILKVLSFTPLIAMFRLGWETIKALFKVEWAVISTVVKVAWAAISTIVKANIAVIKAVILPAINFISDHWKTIWNGMKAVFSSVWHALAAIATPVIDVLIASLNGLIDGINAVISGYNLIPGHSDIGKIPQIPTLETGGIVLKTGLAMVHEGEQFSGVGNSLGGTVNVYVAGSVIAEHDLAETVQKALLRSKRRSGALGLA
jgi:hypothetical protein